MSLEAEGWVDLVFPAIEPPPRQSRLRVWRHLVDKKQMDELESAMDERKRARQMLEERAKETATARKVLADQEAREGAARVRLDNAERAVMKLVRP